MTAFKLSDDILKLLPEERVIAAGLALLKHHRKMPTQDQVVQALSRPDGEKGTGKGTVNKYWPSLQNEIARELSLAEWLPAELPGFVIDHLKQLMDWARQDAETQLSERQAVLSEHERKLDEEAETRKATETGLRNRINELELSLKGCDETISKLREKQASLEQALADVQRTAAVQEEQLNHAKDREEDLSSKVQELKKQVRMSSEALKEKDLELQARQEDNSLLESQLKSLQYHHNEQLRLVSTLKYQVKDLEEQVASSEQVVNDTKNAFEAAKKTIQMNETQLARQEGQLAVLDTLKSSVETLKEAFGKEQERNLALEYEKGSLVKQLKQLESRLATKRPKRNLGKSGGG
jgi:chromosome segregation ATPase